MGLGTYESADAKFGLERDFGAIQQRYAGIFENLIVHDFSGGQNSQF